jgi:geranylgeranylglycerol-phosphate geranylgeranyltransferase
VPSAGDWLALARWPNAVLAGLGVLVGAWWARAAEVEPIAWAVLAAICLTATANSWNDAADCAIDRLAHPGRPIPRGAVTVAEARLLGVAAAAAGLIFAWLARPVLASISLAVIFLFAIYSPFIKKHGALGNVVVAIVASLPFLYGAWAAGSPVTGVVLMGIAAPLHLGREVAKDLDDAAADASSRRTIPLTLGVRSARWLVAAAVVAFIGALALPISWRPLFAIASLPAIFLAALGAAAALRGRRGSPGLLKAAMICAILAALVVRT